MHPAAYPQGDVARMLLRRLMFDKLQVVDDTAAPLNTVEHSQYRPR